MEFVECFNYLNMKKIYLIAALTMGLTAVACNSQTAEENAESADGLLSVV